MTSGELITIGVGLLVGWGAVWLLISKFQGLSVPLAKDLEDLQDNDKPWTDVLGVSPEASGAEIRRAYECKLAQLSERQPSILTEEEMRVQKQLRDGLDAAYRVAVRAGDN